MSEPLEDRLRRLRREPAKVAPLVSIEPGAPVPEAPPELPVWLRAKLRGRAPATPAAVGSLDAPRDLVLDPAGWSARTRRFERGHRHGDWSLDEVLAPALDRTSPGRLTSDPALEAFDFENAVYLDIEATGLSGGAGTIPFMVALGRFDATGFELWQGFLRGPEEERLLLVEVAQRVGASSGVVSFFGKSYDRHRLEDKMCLHGIEPPFAETPHLDLYHPLARLTRGSLPDAKLQRLERELCGVTRADDLPGSFAPAAWFDFLRDRPHRLEDVFRHNEDDVLSLVTLAGYLAVVESESRVDERTLLGCGATRARSLAQWFLKHAELERAVTWSRRAVEREPSAAARCLRADALRRVGEYDAALEDYVLVRETGEPALALRASIEEAKLAEHRLRDPQRALAAIQFAESALRSMAPLEGTRVRLEAELERRRGRLLRLLGSSGSPRV